MYNSRFDPYLSGYNLDEGGTYQEVDHPLPRIWGVVIVTRLLLHTHKILRYQISAIIDFLPLSQWGQVRFEENQADSASFHSLCVTLPPGTPLPYVPASFRRTIFYALHKLSFGLHRNYSQHDIYGQGLIQMSVNGAEAAFSANE